nr:hypothetical protein [Tanacetum cinerariifolium]
MMYGRMARASDHNPNRLICSKFVGYCFSWDLEIVEGEGRVYPVDFDGKKWRKRLKIHIEECLLAIRMTWARPMRMRDFGLWDWGTLSHGVLGEVIDSEEGTEEDVPGADVEGQGEGQAGPNPGAQDEGHARSNPDEKAKCEGQAGPDPGDEEESQPMPSLVVHAGLDHKHMDLDVAVVSPKAPPEQMDEGDNPLESDNDKATTKTEAELMVSVTIQQDMSLISPMKKPTIDLTSRPESPKVHQQLKAIATETTITTTTLFPLPYQQQQSTVEAMMIKRIGELEHIMANLIQENKRLEQRLDSHGARLYTLEQLGIPHQVSKATNEVVTDAVD